jgi:RNA polymerase-binding transcription factor DksA
MLSPQQIEEIRALILAQIAELETMIPSLEERTQPAEVDGTAGRLSRMDELVNRGTVEIALADSRKRLERLRNRLARISDPDFAICSSCRKPLTIERLRAVPDRGICVDCLRSARKPSR